MTLASKGPPLPPEVAAELWNAMNYDRRVGGKLGLNITREWFEKMVALEGDLEIGAGVAARPAEGGCVPQDEQTASLLSRLQAAQARIKVLEGELFWISEFANVRSEDRGPVTVRVAKGAFRTIRDRARSALPQLGGENG